MSEKPVVLITGAARGIGRATAVEFARRGFQVSVVDVLEAEVDETARLARELGVEALPLMGDLADLEFAEGCVGRTFEWWGRIDVLVNNAAWREQQTMREISVDSWERTLRIGLTVPAFLSRWVAQPMEQAGRGVIVNVSSINAGAPRGNAAAYVASKGGLESLTFELAALYGPAGIRVVGVRPGAIDTDLSRDYADDSGRSVTDAMRDWSEDMIPLGRWGRAEEIAKLIALLSSDDASYVTGTIVTADGGWSTNSMPWSLKHLMDAGQFGARS